MHKYAKNKKTSEPIEKIISEEKISTQEELLRKLKGKGISCTQATLSRNLRQLGVGRIPDGTGGYKYSYLINLQKFRKSLHLN
jgi:transcriptional regulator of arginine metabolism